MAVPSSFAFGAKEVKAENIAASQFPYNEDDVMVDLDAIFPDANLRDVVLFSLQKEGHDVDVNAGTHKAFAKLSTIKSLKNISNEYSGHKNKKILDFSGIDIIENLESFKIIYDNEDMYTSGVGPITSIDFGNNKKLKRIYITGYKNLKFIKLDNPDLIELDASNNGLEELNFIKCPKLNYLNVDRNMLHELDASKSNSNLGRISCNYNDISNLKLRRNERGEINTEIDARNNPLIAFPQCKNPKSKFGNEDYDSTQAWVKYHWDMRGLDGVSEDFRVRTNNIPIIPVLDTQYSENAYFENDYGYLTGDVKLNENPDNYYRLVYTYPFGAPDRRGYVDVRIADLAQCQDKWRDETGLTYADIRQRTTDMDYKRSSLGDINDPSVKPYSFEQISCYSKHDTLIKEMLGNSYEKIDDRRTNKELTRNFSLYVGKAQEEMIKEGNAYVNEVRTSEAYTYCKPFLDTKFNELKDKIAKKGLSINDRNIAQSHIQKIYNDATNKIEAANNNPTENSKSQILYTTYMTYKHLKFYLDNELVDDATKVKYEEDFIKAIEEAAIKKNDEIGKMPNATNEAKQEAKEKVETEKTKGIQAVKKAKTDKIIVSEMAIERDKAIEAINAINVTTNEELEQAKSNAFKEINEAAAKRKVEIDAVKNADADEVKAAKAKVEKEKADGISAVTDAKTIKAINDEKDKAVDAIEKVALPKTAEEVLANAKKDAKAKIEEAANKKNEEIDNSDATAKAKSEAKAKVEEEKAKGINKVEAADSIAKVETAKNEAIEAIGAVKVETNIVLKLSKYEAKEAVEKAATKRIEEIEAVKGADADDIAKARQEVNEAKAAGIANIEKGETSSEVAGARDEAKKVIGNVALPTDKLTALKDEAKKAIEEAAAKRNGEIDAVKNADADEVKAAKAKVEKEKADGVNAVEKANTVKAVNEAKDAAIEAIGKVELPKAGGVTPPAPTGEYTITFNPNGGKVAKETAKTDKDGKLKDMPSATYEGYIFEGWYTKKDAGDKVDTNTVFKADTVIYAHWKEDKAYQDELDNIKKELIKDLEKIAAERKTELEKTPKATNDQITKAKEKVDELTAKGKEKINNATTKQKANDEHDAAVSRVRNVTVDTGTAADFGKYKEDAKSEIDDKAKEAKDKIDENPNLTDEEKDKAKEEIDKTVDAGKKQIDEQTDRDGVDKEKGKAEEEIGSEEKKAEEQGKENVANKIAESVKAIKEKAEAKKKEITDNAKATQKAKEEAIKAVEAKETEGIKKVEAQKTLEDVNYERDNAIKEIESIEVKTTTPTGKEYEVKFISNKIGATKEEVVETRKIKEGEKVGDLPKALTDENRPDYRFSGWYTKKEGGDKLEAETKIEKEMTIYAHWKKRPIAKNYADVSGNKFSIKGTKNLNVNEGVYQDEKLPKNTRPYQLTVTAKPSRRMLVEWTNCKKLGADIDGYIITRKVGRSDTFVHYATVGANRNYFIDTLPKKNTNYYYMVFGYKKDKMGNITISENSMSAVGQRLDSAKINPYAPKLNYTKKTIRQGESVKLRLTYPKNSISTWTRWRTHNDAVKVAKVNQQGVVTGLNKGKVLVSARTPNGRDIRCLITVI